LSAKGQLGRNHPGEGWDLLKMYQKVGKSDRIKKGLKPWFIAVLIKST
jgi:hypothetical protein